MARKSKKLPRLENTWIADFYEILGTSGAGKRAAAGQLFRAARGGVKTFRAPPGHVVVPVTAEVPQYQPASAKTIREKYEASPEGRAKAEKLAARASKKAAPAASAAPLTPPKRRGRPPKAMRGAPSVAEVSLEQMPAAMMAAPAMTDADDLSRRMAARRARADMRRSNIAAKRAAAAQAAEVARRAEAAAADARRAELEAETKREAERAAREREAAEAAAREAEREAERKRAEAEAAERAKTAAPSQAEIQMASNAVREALRAKIAELRASLKK